MPLLQKPRDPKYGVKRARRKPGRRKMLHASPLPETVMYLDAQKIGRGRVIDAAIELYKERRHDLKPIFRTKEAGQAIGTTVAPETLAYVKFMSSAMTPGELIDDAIRLHRQVHEK